MAAISDAYLRGQLEERRQRLEGALASMPEVEPIHQLLHEVDAALERMERGEYGLCESCHESIEKDRLIADPLVRFCLAHLNSAEQRALEQDLQLAARIQKGLLPQADMRAAGWRIHHHYEPAGLVSGDYCDIIQPSNGDGELFFLLGDVSGKGVASSMLMSQLHAMFRSLATVGMPVDRLLGLANRLFCESTMAGYYATLVCGSAGRGGEIRLASAGHCPPLLLRKGEAVAIESTGLPLGMFGTSEYAVREYKLEPGESLFLYTDGVSESRDAASAEYGAERLSRFLAGRSAQDPAALTAACLADVRKFSVGTAKADDLTIMVLRREA
jgi:sigma-B regulation protein RsbU (phosphoserine phosphatase)